MINKRFYSLVHYAFDPQFFPIENINRDRNKIKFLLILKVSYEKSKYS
ncbi:MAG: hypothetical protein ISS28_03555 [Candidatus Cloacimonetes bacterium]|nr:hypothetical protein [Candidatus Cloacimonadota bacterium]MBL7086168.1 hypothetical protein [Candidatus Cloacimonadota bacterium]